MRVSKFLSLGREDRWLLVRSACVLVAMCLGVRALSLRRLQEVATRGALTRRAVPAARRHAAGRIAWAVRAAARHVPGATCLPQALAAQFMLARHGHPARLRIGVATGQGRLAGHAWVEGDRVILIGGDDVTRYAPLPAPGAEHVPGGSVRG